MKEKHQTNNVSKTVSHHFNSTNHSFSNMNVCAISTISGCKYSIKRQERHLIFKPETFNPHNNNCSSLIQSLTKLLFLFRNNKTLPYAFIPSILKCAFLCIIHGFQFRLVNGKIHHRF